MTFGWENKFFESCHLRHIVLKYLYYDDCSIKSPVVNIGRFEKISLSKSLHLELTNLQSKCSIKCHENIFFCILLSASNKR